MKKSMVTKIAALGAIGIMTIAGASSAFAADNGMGRNTVKEYMSEAEAMQKIADAENQGHLEYIEGDTAVITFSNGTYKYSFEQTDTKSYQSEGYDTEEIAKDKEKTSVTDPSLLLHDTSVVEDYYWNTSCSPNIFRVRIYCVAGTQYYGNLVIAPFEVNSISLSQNKDTIPSDGSDSVELTYGVNELACADDVQFKSSNNAIATVEKFGDKAYVVGHKQGSVVITASAGSAAEYACVDVVDVMPQ